MLNQAEMAIGVDVEPEMAIGVGIEPNGNGDPHVLTFNTTTTTDVASLSSWDRNEYRYYITTP